MRDFFSSINLRVPDSICLLSWLCERAEGASQLQDTRVSRPSQTHLILCSASSRFFTGNFPLCALTSLIFPAIESCVRFN